MTYLCFSFTVDKMELITPPISQSYYEGEIREPKYLKWCLVLHNVSISLIIITLKFKIILILLK